MIYELNFVHYLDELKASHCFFTFPWLNPQFILSFGVSKVQHFSLFLVLILSDTTDPPALSVQTY